jgi:hypothetical protein
MNLALTAWDESVGWFRLRSQELRQSMQRINEMRKWRNWQTHQT